MGQKEVKVAVFRNYLKNYQLDLVHFLREKRYYKTAYMCKVSSPYQFLFLRYWGKRGLILGFSAFSQKVSVRFGSFSQEKKILQSYIHVQSFKSVPILVLEIWGKKGSELGVFGIFSKSITSIWFILSGKEDIIELHTRAKFQVHTNFGS